MHIQKRLQPIEQTIASVVLFIPLFLLIAFTGEIYFVKKGELQTLPQNVFMILLRDPDCPPNCAGHPHGLETTPVFPRSLLHIPGNKASQSDSKMPLIPVTTVPVIPIQKNHPRVLTSLKT